MKLCVFVSMCECVRVLVRPRLRVCRYVNGGLAVASGLWWHTLNQNPLNVISSHYYNSIVSWHLIASAEWEVWPSPSLVVCNYNPLCYSKRAYLAYYAILHQFRTNLRTWYQQTLLRQNSYGNASIKSCTDGLLLLYQLMHQSSHCVTLFRVILKTKLALYNQLSQVILRTRFMQTLHN